MKHMAAALALLVLVTPGSLAIAQYGGAQQPYYGYSPYGYGYSYGYSPYGYGTPGSGYSPDAYRYSPYGYGYSYSHADRSSWSTAYSRDNYGYYSPYHAWQTNDDSFNDWYDQSLPNNWHDFGLDR